MTKNQIKRLNKLNIPIKKYFGFFRYYNYRLRGRNERYRKVLTKIF